MQHILHVHKILYTEQLNVWRVILRSSEAALYLYSLLKLYYCRAQFKLYVLRKVAGISIAALRSMYNSSCRLPRCTANKYILYYTAAFILKLLFSLMLNRPVTATEAEKVM